MPINRAPWTALIDDDGSNMVGTVWNKDKIKTVILDPVDALVGSWIVPAYNAAGFAGNGSMIWTVEAADLGIAYVLNNKTLTVAWAINSSSISGTLGNTLIIHNTMWGGYTASRPTYNAVAFLVNGAASAGFIQTSGSQIQIIKVDQAPYVASTNATYCYGQITFQVP